MDFTEALIKEYAKKIFAFAFSKTKDHHNAEDLSQEIIMALCDETIEHKDIDNMNAYIYRICFYSWSKFLRKNKPTWEALKNPNIFDYIVSDINLEEKLVYKELHNKLRQEIMYLSKAKRDITIMFYYESKSGKEISNILGMPASTVRWHLSQSKKELKERIEMNCENDIYKPIKLAAGRNGWRQSYNQYALGTDVLMQNICWLCHGNPLRIEDIAQTLGVAAIYLEDKIEKLIFMDYMIVVGNNKYKTNFFIPDKSYQLANKKFHLEHTMPIAEQFYNVIKNALPEIKKVNFNRHAFSDNYLTWQLITLPIFNEINKINCEIIESKGLQHGAPRRKDGTKHWALASISMTDILSEITDISEELHNFCTQEKENRIKMPTAESLQALQFDLGFMGGYRDFSKTELQQLKRVHEITTNNENPNFYDKEIIANLIKLGYVSNESGNLKILVPYFAKNQMNTISSILDKYSKQFLNKEVITKIFIDYINTMNKKIPHFVNTNERNHLLTGYSPYITILWLLYKNSYIKKPTEQEIKTICTVIWER